MTKILYKRAFYEARQEKSASSADVIVPLVLSLFKAKSVVDVGCGNGTWLRAFVANGIEDYLGIDGEHVPNDLLQVPVQKIRRADLRTVREVGRRFDIACSLEVAEHLPPDYANQFIGLLVAAAPVVLFSAAIPKQGGTGHVNEQPQSYWWSEFSRHGYVAVDCIRPRVFGDRRIDWWYRQNTLIYCDTAYRPPDYPIVSDQFHLDQIDPGMIEAMTNVPLGVRAAVNALTRDIRSLGNAILHKLR